jgi:hypothetical protein
MADAYDAAVSYRDSILERHRGLCGDELPEDTQSWQETASVLSFELRRYAQFLDDCVEGRVRGPIVFPSWEERS